MKTPFKKKLPKLPPQPITLSKTVEAELRVDGIERRLAPGDNMVVTLSRTPRFGGVKQPTHLLVINFVEHIEGAVTTFTYKPKSRRKGSK